MIVNRFQFLRGLEQLPRRLSGTFGHVGPNGLDGVFGLSTQEDHDGVQLGKVKTIHRSWGHVQKTNEGTLGEKRKCTVRPRNNGCQRTNKFYPL